MGQSLSSILIMKVLVVLTLIGLASVNAVSWSDCDGCKEGMKPLLEQAQSEEVIALQLAALKTKACTQLDDVEGCDKGVETWWPQINAALFGGERAAGHYCADLGMCDKPTPTPPSFFKQFDACQHCKDGLTAFFDLFNEEEHIEHTVRLLDSKAFCENPDFDPATQAGCKTYVEAFIPIALPVLSADAKPHVEEVCTELYKLCP